LRLALVFLVGCAQAKAPEPTTPGCGAGDIPVDTECHIWEGTNPTINAHDVGVGNIYPRNGRMSASVSVFDPATRQEDDHRSLFVGEEVAIGNQRYRFSSVGGTRTPQWITLRRLP
jgi:hypothetical protein